MIVYKKFWARREYPLSTMYYWWEREGWFLFGFIPLYTRDISYRNAFSTTMSNR